MTREQAKELMPIITAYAEGKTIQYRAGEDCPFETLTGDPRFTETPSGYRIKPEPKTVLMTAYDLPEGIIWLKKDSRIELVTVFWDDGRLETESDSHEFIKTLHQEGVTWSTDRKNWKPFTKEVEA